MLICINIASLETFLQKKISRSTEARLLDSAASISKHPAEVGTPNAFIFGYTYCDKFSMMYIIIYN